MNPHDTNDASRDETNAADEREALLTAYVLGETDDAQTGEVEALLANDAAAAAQVEEIRATAALLVDGFAAESGEHLPAAARDAVTAAAGTIETAQPAGRVRSLWPLVGMAASVGVGIGLAAWFGRTDPAGIDVAGARNLRTHVAGESASELTEELGSGAALRERIVDGRRVRDGAGRPEVDFDGVFFGSSGKPADSGGGEMAAGPSAGSGEGGGRPYYYGAGGGAGAGHGVDLPGGSGATLTSAEPQNGARETTGTTVHVFGRHNNRNQGGQVGAVAGSALTPVDQSTGGGYRGPGGQVPPDSRAPSDPPPRPGLLGGPTTPGMRGPAVPGSDVGVGVTVVDGLSAGSTEEAKVAELLTRAKNTSPEVLRVEVVRLQQQVEQTLADSKFLQTGAGGQLEDLRVMRRFLADGNEVDVEELAETWTAYSRVAAEVRRVKAEDFRRRHGVSYGIPGSEDYEHPGESIFRDPADEPLSTFSIDVDTASYANVRRFLNNGQLPPPAAVRIEEMVNYFAYSDPPPQGEHPIAATLETATCPWNTRSRLVRVGLKAKTFDEPPPPANLVFLIDVSGSMQPADKLPLLQQAMKMLTEQMREGDRVAIVTYASNSGVRLQSTDGSQKDVIRGCIDGLNAGGSTNGGSGIVDAYRIAQEHFVEGGVNRVILATDGDFNVGVTDRGELTRLIEEKAKSGVFLSVLGVGTGNLKDATLESLADRGNGNYHYLDGLREARKVLVDELMGTMVTVAKDVKIQIEFNPAVVGAYRLIGYENRMLAAADFNDDTKDAGEMGAGHTVTALYEIVPAGTAPQEGVDPLRYQKTPPSELTDEAQSGEMLTLKVRYKLPEASESTRVDMTLTDSGTKFDEASEDLRFASAVASFGMLLRGSPAAAGTSYDAVLELAQGAIGEDRGGHRAELLDLVLKAKKLSGR